MLPHETIGSTRTGAACLAAAGLLVPSATLLRGSFVDPHGDAAAFAAWVTGRSYMPAGILFIGGILFQIFGAMALYMLLARGGSPRLAFIGTLLTLLIDALLLVTMGVFCFTLPEVGRMYLEGHREALSIATAFGAPFTAFLVVQALGLVVGTVLTAIAIGRSPALPQWSGWTYAVSGIVIAFSPPIPFQAELPATVLFGMTYFTLAGRMWRTAGIDVRSPRPA